MMQNIRRDPTFRLQNPDLQTVAGEKHIQGHTVQQTSSVSHNHQSLQRDVTFPWSSGQTLSDHSHSTRAPLPPTLSVNVPRPEPLVSANRPTEAPSAGVGVAGIQAPTPVQIGRMPVPTQVNISLVYLEICVLYN